MKYSSKGERNERCSGKVASASPLNPRFTEHHGFKVLNILVEQFSLFLSIFNLMPVIYLGNLCR